eukprot:5742449-Prymnesium_polylepis.1
MPGSTIIVRGFNLTISSAGEGATLDGHNGPMIFNVASDGVLELYSMTLRRGHGLSAGGVLVDGVVRLWHSRIENCSAAGQSLVSAARVSGRARREAGGGGWRGGGARVVKGSRERLAVVRAG